MKIYKSILFATLFSLSSISASASSTDGKITKENIDTKTESEINARMKLLEKRLEEIKGMDFSTLERSEKKTLKKEVKEIKKEMAISGYITISAGLLIIILLLIILL